MLTNPSAENWVTVVIPTYDRVPTLKRTLETLRNQSFKRVRVILVVDGNPAVLPIVAKLPVVSNRDTLIYNRQRRDWIYSMNLALKIFDEGAVVYASDDLEFGKECLEIAWKLLFTKAPDGDAMVQITQDVKGCSSAFAMFGFKWMLRFPHRQVFCLDYVHYCSDWELGRYARTLGRFYECQGAKVMHARLKDTTMRLAKNTEQRDYRARDERAAKGLLWGLSFERVTVEARP